MCEPVTIGLVVGGATMAGQAAASSSASKQQNRYLDSQSQAQAETYAKTVESVTKDVNLQTETLFTQRLEMIAGQKQQLMNISRDARNASGRMATAVAEAGVEGRTVGMLHDQFEREVADFESAAIRNISNYTAQVNREAQAIYARGQSIINSGYPAPLPPYSSPNIGGAVLSVLTAGINAGIASYSAFGKPKVGTGMTGGGTVPTGGS